MSSSPRTLTPSRSADDLAQRLAQAGDVHTTILDETLNSAENGVIHESGRTVCGPQEKPRGPLARFPTAVELESCPIGEAGVWHTHVNPRQLRDPEHSIPDIANVVYGEAAASMVVGTNSGELLAQAADQQAMQQAFEDALGVSPDDDDGELRFEDAQDVAAAIQDGEITPNEQTHMKVRDRLDGLVWRVSTGYNALDSRIDQSVSEEAAEAWSCSAHKPPQQPVEPVDGLQSPDVGRLRERARPCAAMAKEASSGISLKEIAIGQFVGTIVGHLTERYVFDA